MTRRFAILPLIAWLGLISSPALAQEGQVVDWANKSGSFGVGGNTTLGGTTGINVRTFLTPLFGLRATMQMGIDSASIETAGETADVSSTKFQMGLYSSYKLAYWQRGSLGVLFGGDLERLNQSFEMGGVKTEDSSTNILLGLGFIGEWFPTQYLSLFAEAGLRIDFLGPDEVDEGVVDPSATDPSGIRLDLRSDLWGAAGFTVWFN